LLTFSSKKPPVLWLHGLLLAAPLALLTPALASLETPLPDGIYRAERGYWHVSENCQRHAEIADVKISGGEISFENGGANWLGTISEKTGIIRIESPGITPRPKSALHIRGHYSRAQLFSAICGAGYFRIIR
jgi:hypothetical protein